MTPKARTIIKLALENLNERIMKPPSGCHWTFDCYSHICGILPCSLLACNYAVGARDAIRRKNVVMAEARNVLTFFWL